MEPEKNTINIIFDPEKQSVGLKFKHEDFKTWDFVLGMLEMAKVTAQAQKQQSLMMSAMQQQAQAHQAAKIISNIRG